MKRSRSTAGFTLLELLLALALLGIFLVKVSFLVSRTSEVVEQESQELVLEDQARLVLDRIALAILASDRDALAPILSPDHSTGIRYQVSLGIEDGEVVWDDPQEILFVQEAGEVLWRQNPDQPNERRAVWTHDVLQLLEGEEVNDVDDNGNGLIDEEGLNFTVEGNQVTIRLSLGVTLEEGERIVRSVETTVTCRNNPLP